VLGCWGAGTSTLAPVRTFSTSTLAPVRTFSTSSTIGGAYNRSRMVLLPLLLLALVCWLWIVVMARDMYGPMTGASAWMMTPVWDAPHLLLLWAMWAVMMTGMMLPAASKMILLAGSAAGQRDGRTSLRQSSLLAIGYLAVWALFSVAATALQWWLMRTHLVTPMMEISSPRVGAALLIAAGLYQLTPWKRACLVACQSPLAFLMRRWRSGSWGAVRMGAEHGVRCVGCCWALMLLLFAGGVMNLAVIAALTAFVAFEKLAPTGPVSTRISGALLIGLGAWMGVGF
jgi:predicted metal-binding membrane protein